MRTLVLVMVGFLASTAHSDPAADRVAAAAKVYAMLHVETVPAEDLYRWSVRWLDARLGEPATTGKAVAIAFAEHAQRMIALEAATKKAFDAGIKNAVELAATSYFRVEAELWVARGKK